MNTSRRACLRAGPVILAAALAACASAPAQYYRLAAIPGAIRNGAPSSIGVRSISIPGYLDQNGIAKGTGDYQFGVYSNELWADRLDDMLQSVMVQDLAQRLPAATVIGSGGSIGMSSDVLIEINVLRFDPDSTGKIILTTQIAIKSGRTRALWATRTFQNSATPDNANVSYIVATMSMLWASMADQVADLIVEYSASQPPESSGTD
jgi:uncharacterized lipoprotein YmbA